MNGSLLKYIVTTFHSLTTMLLKYFVLVKTNTFLWNIAIMITFYEWHYSMVLLLTGTTWCWWWSCTSCPSVPWRSPTHEWVWNCGAVKASESVPSVNWRTSSPSERYIEASYINTICLKKYMWSFSMYVAKLVISTTVAIIWETKIYK